MCSSRQLAVNAHGGVAALPVEAAVKEPNAGQGDVVDGAVDDIDGGAEDGVGGANDEGGKGNEEGRRSNCLCRHHCWTFSATLKKVGARS